MKNTLHQLAIGVAGGATALVMQHLLHSSLDNHTPIGSPQLLPSAHAAAPASNWRTAPVVPMLDFAVTARAVTPTVVHIRTQGSNSKGKSVLPDSWGGTDQLSEGSGSGVIISNKGHIVTNRHVVSNARSISVTLNDRSTYAAQVVGIDAATDIALLKIDAGRSLPSLDYGDSDAVQVGDWVLAVGNPFNLASTVTAGIVSAKARNINISASNSAVESFIQTDAAVNPGNSGGALVDASGKLVGINTAIATPTGYFAGYSFAVPVTLVRKVVEDFLRFGSIRRAYLGVSIADVDGIIAQQLRLADTKGVCIQRVNSGSAAQKAGIQANDVVVRLENRDINNTSELQEMVNRYRPGDRITVRIIRKGETKDIKVQLQE